MSLTDQQIADSKAYLVRGMKAQEDVEAAFRHEGLRDLIHDTWPIDYGVEGQIGLEKNRGMPRRTLEEPVALHHVPALDAIVERVEPRRGFPVWWTDAI